jgi:hypothetical protein
VRVRDRRRIEAFRDGALPPDAARRLRQRMQEDVEAARVVEQTEVLGRAVREAWTDGPSGPDSEWLLAQVRPGLARIDRELAEEGGLRTIRDRAARWLMPVWNARWAVSAAAAGLALLLLLPTLLPVTQTPGLAHAEAGTVIRSLQQQERPVLVLEGADGATIIWVLDEEDPDVSSGAEVVRARV